MFCGKAESLSRIKPMIGIAEVAALIRVVGAAIYTLGLLGVA
jgi:hypothetical protein